MHPRQLPPIRIEEQYAAALVRLLAPVIALYRPLLAGLAERTDFDPEESRDPAGKWTSGAMASPEYAALADQTLGKLSPAQYHAVGRWYSSGYRSINALARTGTPSIAHAPIIRDLDAAIASGRAPRDLTVYRGLDDRRAEDVHVGDVISDRGYVATSVSRATAERFAAESGAAHQNPGAVVRIAIPRGATALAVGKSLDEFLLPRNSSFRVLDVRREGSWNGTRRVVDVELVVAPPAGSAVPRHDALGVKWELRYAWAAADVEIRRARTDDFNPEENRDPAGKWTSGGESGAPATAHETKERTTAKEWVKANPNGNEHVFDTAQEYLRQAGHPSLRVLSQQTLTPEEGRKIADGYDAAKDDPKNADTRAAYQAFNVELAAQRAVVEHSGYRFEPWGKTGQPYATSKEMMKDVRDNKHLYYFKTSEGTTPNELMTPAQNDTFRAVHDLFGHAMGGNQFGPKGETNAFLDHVQMFSPEARKALATETIGQNGWFNFSRANEGKPVAERKFADQKAFILDPALYQPVIDRSEQHADRRDDEADDYATCPCHRDARRARTDTPETDRLRRLIGMAAKNLRAVTETNRVAVGNLASRFADRTAGYQREQLSRQVHAVLGIEPDKIRDADISHRTADFVRDNVALISRIPAALHGDVEEMVRDAVRVGRRNQALARDLSARFGVSERHARLIARDQIGKYYADVNHARQRALGVRRFTWRTAGDERVRPSHDELDGEVFDYDDPPEVDGEVALPGEPVQCRCWADGVLEDLL